MKLATGEGYRIPLASELKVGDKVEIYEQATSKLIRDVRWHEVEIIEKWGNVEPVGGEHSVCLFNRIRKLINAGKLRVKI